MIWMEVCNAPQSTVDGVEVGGTEVDGAEVDVDVDVDLV